MLDEPHVALEIQQQVVARHDAAGEEVAAPSSRFRRAPRTGRRIRWCVKMCTNNVAAGRHPARHARQQRLVVAHVLEHLDRDHAVEASVPGKLEPVDVAGDDFEVGEAALARARASMNCFCVREFDTATIARAAGSAAAIHRLSEPQPQPSSRIASPSARRARWQVSASMRSSASSRARPGDS